MKPFLGKSCIMFALNTVCIGNPQLENNLFKLLYEII